MIFYYKYFWDKFFFLCKKRRLLNNYRAQKTVLVEIKVEFQKKTKNLFKEMRKTSLGFRNFGGGRFFVFYFQSNPTKKI